MDKKSYTIKRIKQLCDDKTYDCRGKIEKFDEQKFFKEALKSGKLKLKSSSELKSWLLQPDRRFGNYHSVDVKNLFTNFSEIQTEATEKDKARKANYDKQCAQISQIKEKFIDQVTYNRVKDNVLDLLEVDLKKI